MHKTGIIGILLVAMLLVLGACAPTSEPEPFPPPEGYSSWDAYYEETGQSPPTTTPTPDTEAPAKVPEDTSGHIYTDGATECGGDGEPIVLINNPEAINPTYAEVIAFITKDTTNSNSYIKGGPEGYVCADFAEEVHNNAETGGIRAAWVGVEFEGDIEGHALNAFQTTDKGLVYIDCTGELEKTWIFGSYLFELHPVTFESWLHEKSIPDSAILTEWDTVAYVEVGKEYGLIGINEAKSLEYDFYLEYTQKWREYELELEAYNREVEQYNQEISGKVYVEGSSELARIEVWEAELDKQEQILDSLGEELGYCRYEPSYSSGIVTDIHIHW